MTACLYRGKGIYCPCCKREHRRYIFVGFNTAHEAHCPGCGSLGRDRLISLYLERERKQLPGGARVRLLDVAPTRVLSSYLRKEPDYDYSSIDLDSPTAMGKMDLTALQFQDNSFDLILCLHVLEHIPQDRQAISELHRVLKRGGCALIQVPHDPDRLATYENAAYTSRAERKRHFGQSDHVRIYGEDFKERLALGGFLVSEKRPAHDMPLGDIEKNGLQEGEVVFVCTK